MHNLKLNHDIDIQMYLYESIPDYVRVLREKRKPTIYLPKKPALEFERIQLHRNDRLFLMTDYDIKGKNKFVDHTHYDLEPNIIIYNPKQGNHQGLFRIKNKVFCQKSVQKNQPYRYLRAIEAAYDEKYNCDNGFGRVVSRNPFCKGVNVDWRHNRSYTLGELAEPIDLNPARIEKANATATEELEFTRAGSRNWTVFTHLLKWGYRQRRSVKTSKMFFQRCLTQSMTYNSFKTKPPMKLIELEEISRSVVKNVLKYLSENKESFEDYVARTHTTEIQAKRGRKGGLKSKGGGRPQSRDENLLKEIKYLKNDKEYSNRKIASELKISSSTVSKYLNFNT